MMEMPDHQHSEVPVRSRCSYVVRIHCSTWKVSDTYEHEYFGILRPPSDVQDTTQVRASDQTSKTVSKDRLDTMSVNTSTPLIHKECCYFVS